MRDRVRCSGRRPPRRSTLLSRSTRVEEDKKHSSRSTVRVGTATTVLVGSFLVLNAPIAAHAAPQPVRTAAAVHKHARAAVGAVATDNVRRASAGQLSFDDVDDIVAASRDTSEQLVYPLDGSDSNVPRFIHNPTPTPTQLARRDWTETDDNGSVTTHTDAPFTVPPSFASNIASSWDPGKRSIWFQRKAVIITSIFLAIFIVLIMGCAVFLRGKRDDDEDLDYDESDEAAVERMRREREDKQSRAGDDAGSRKKKSKRRKKRNAGSAAASNDADAVDEKDGGGIKATAIVASRWTRNPVRRIKLRRRQAREAAAAASENGSGTRVAGSESPVGSRASHAAGNVSHSTLNSANNGSTLVASGTDGAGSSRATGFHSDVTTPAEHPISYAEIAGEHRSGEHGEGARPGPSAPHSAGQDADSWSQAGRGRSERPRGTLTAQDIALADAEASRAAAEMMPPAYRPNGAGGNAGGSGAAPMRRRLAGEDEERSQRAEHEAQRLFQEARGDRKVSPRDEQDDDEEARRALHSANGAEGVNTSSRSSDTSRVSSEHAGTASQMPILSGHVATDEKAALRQLRAAASQPDVAPHYVASRPQYAPHAPGSHTSQPNLTSTELPTAPDLEAADEQEAIAASRAVSEAPAAEAPAAETSTYPNEKGKQSLRQVGSSRLPPPPAPPQDAAFSRFDMPYVLERPAHSSPRSQHSSLHRVVTTVSGTPGAADDEHSAPPDTSENVPTARQREKEKQREAAEEERQALSLLASQPGEGRDLPRYESASAPGGTGTQPSAPTAPSAPAFFEDDDQPSSPSTVAPSAPSAPPLNEDD